MAAGRQGDSGTVQWKSRRLTFTSVARQGSSSAFQITVHKNLNGFHRAEGISSHTSLKAPVARKISYVSSIPRVSQQIQVYTDRSTLLEMEREPFPLADRR